MRGHSTKTVRDREAPGSNPGPPTNLTSPSYQRTGSPRSSKRRAKVSMSPGMIEHPAQLRGRHEEKSSKSVH
jgi:hypothetical protein